MISKRTHTLFRLADALFAAFLLPAIAVVAGLAAMGSAIGQGPVSSDANGDAALDIVYKSTPVGDLRLDLLYPEIKPASGKFPLVVYTHGEGWASGSRKKGISGGPITDAVAGFVKNGFCVALVEYRLCKDGQVMIRDCVTDAKDAVRYLAKNSAQYSIDPERVFTFGDSAGGQIAQMLLLTPPDSLPGDKGLAGVPYKMVAGVSWYGPCDFEKMELFSADPKKPARDRFGGRICPPGTAAEEKLRLYREVSPVNYLSKSSPPLLMVQGDGDTTIPVHHARYMKEKAEAIGAPVEILIIENAGHNWRTADETIRGKVPTKGLIDRSVEFLTQSLR